MMTTPLKQPQKQRAASRGGQSIRSIDEGAVNACRVSQCTTYLLHCFSGEKDAMVTFPSMRRKLTHTIKNITKLEIACPDQSKTISLYDRTAHACDRLDFDP